MTELRVAAVGHQTARGIRWQGTASEVDLRGSETVGTVDMGQTVFRCDHAHELPVEARDCARDSLPVEQEDNHA